MKQLLWLIRAKLKGGQVSSIEFVKEDAILIFHNMFEHLEQMQLPTTDLISKTWKEELLPSFVDPQGIVVCIELCQQLYDNEIFVCNTMWFEQDAEGRSLLKTEHPVNISYDFVDTYLIGDDLHGITAGDRIFQTLQKALKETPDSIMEFHQDEMSADYHMGYFEERPILKNTWGEDPLFFTPSDKTRRIELGPQIVSSTEAEWYDENSIEQHYRIFIGHLPSSLIVTDIEFMEKLSQMSYPYRLDGIHGVMEMDQDLYNLLIKFIKQRNFSIGANPIEEELEDGRGASHILKWDAEMKEIIHEHPEM